MKSSEIKEAAGKYVAEHVWEIDYECDFCAEKGFQAGAKWMQDHLRERIKTAMGALWDEDEITGSLWLGSTAICLIKAALEIEPEVDESIPFDGEGEL